jgi:hypothetical protein
MQNYIYSYIRICMYIYTNVCLYTYLLVFMCTYIYIIRPCSRCPINTCNAELQQFECMKIGTSISIYLYIFMNIHVYTCMCLYKCNIYLCAHCFVFIQIYIYIYIYIYRYTHISIYTELFEYNGTECSSSHLKNVLGVNRRGRWTEEEYEYALALIEAFNAGTYLLYIYI